MSSYLEIIFSILSLANIQIVKMNKNILDKEYE